jgi:hypothetical protein
MNVNENLPISLTHAIGTKMHKIAHAKTALEELIPKTASTDDFRESTSKVT